jgi:undecaprenyl-diphosphatase
VDNLQAIILALVQGVTEFLPISSSAHLILVPRFLGWTDQGLAFDVAVHFGTLLAVIYYFRAQLSAIVSGWTCAILHRPHDAQDAQLGWTLLAATAPLVVGGLLLEDLVETTLRSPLVIAAATAFFGVLLWVADRRPDRIGRVGAVNLRAGVLIGLAQVLALIPGTSRSGITMTAGLALGLDRETAARFSFLLAIPAIAGAALLKFVELLQSTTPVPWVPMGLGLGMAAVSAWLCIRLFLAAIQRIGMIPFVVYRLLLAAVILVVFW